MQTPSVVDRIPSIRDHVRTARKEDKSIGLVPTMGALHAGHISLLRRARAENDFLVTSIFVNPLQFDRGEDLDKYPRTLARDLAVCAEAGVDLVFAPPAGEIYPAEPQTFVDLPALSEHLCGRFRPGHFRGVATVVLKLFQIVQPQRAYFGQKDAQQLAIIRRMVEDLNVPVTIVPVETVREPDGLALSSRNVHLTEDQRRIAPALYRALCRAHEILSAGERSVQVVRQQALQLLEAHPEIRVEYFELAHPELLFPLTRIDGPVLIAGAVWLGNTRLIDNLTFPGTT